MPSFHTAQNGHSAKSLRYIPLSYDNADSEASALKLVLTLFPDWEGAGNNIEFVRFTDGITNTLLKIINRKPGWNDEQVDSEAVLMRAYGNHTEILIDRERETKSHASLAQRGLAPPLLARFQNGLLYRFIRGQVATPDLLIRGPVWKGVARRLAQWHALLPTSESITANPIEAHPLAIGKKTNGYISHSNAEDDITPVSLKEPGPSLWSVLQKWILALPVTTKEQRARRRSLQMEFEHIVDELDTDYGIGDKGLVFAHCDLLSANVIILPQPGKASSMNHDVEKVHFIDYEYATPSPAAFDIANHFAEWGGYDCDYNMLPTRAVRREFLTEYVRSYNKNRGVDNSAEAETIDELYADVDRFRGIPGFYWGVWALIQATISQINFDYASYAEVRLGEYWAWRREQDGSRAKTGEEMPLRERRWAQEA